MLNKDTQDELSEETRKKLLSISKTIAERTYRSRRPVRNILRIISITLATASLALIALAGYVLVVYEESTLSSGNLSLILGLITISLGSLILAFISLAKLQSCDDGLASLEVVCHLGNKREILSAVDSQLLCFGKFKFMIEEFRNVAGTEKR